MNSKSKITGIVMAVFAVIAGISAMLFNGGDSPSDEPAASLEVVTTTAAQSTAEMSEETSEETAAAQSTSPPETTAAETAEQPAFSEPETQYTEYKFRSKKLLTQHFEKHGIEMGFENAEDYETAASDVINSPEALFKTEAEDGDGVYYIEDTNEFVILSTDGYIRTYFEPSGGKAYFDRQ